MYDSLGNLEWVRVILFHSKGYHITGGMLNLECRRCDTGKYFIVTSLHDSISALERRVGAHFGDFFPAECMQSYSDSRNLHCMKAGDEQQAACSGSLHD